MNLEGLSWKQYIGADAENKERWIDDLRRSEHQTEVSVLSTRIRVPGDHLLIRPGQRGSVVVTCFQRESTIPLEKPDLRRQLLSISFDTLSDWHIVLEPTNLKVFNNRVSRGALVRAEVRHEDLPPHSLGQLLGVGGYAVTPDFQDITDRMLERIAFLKKMLIGDPDNRRLKDTRAIDDILNAVIFLRFLEDCENAKGNNRINLRALMSSHSISSLSSLISTVFRELRLPEATSLFNLPRLEKLPDHINAIILDWLPTSYRDNKQGRYEYDLSLIAEHAIGQIYDKYISMVSYHTQNGKLSLFPEYDTELHWQRGTGLLYTPEFIARFLVSQTLRNFDPSRWKDLKVGDLACGSGVFLRNFLLRLQAAKQVTGGITSRVLQNLEATDINRSAVAAARLSIAMTSYKYTQQMPQGFQPKTANSLSLKYRNEHVGKKLDIILMNPPFKGYEQQLQKERQTVTRVLGNYRLGKPDYSLAFLKFAFDRLTEHGCLGIVLPASFIDGKYAQGIRKLLAENGDVQIVAKFDEYTLFNRGQTQIVLITFRKETGSPTACGTKVLYCRTLPDLAVRALETEKYDTRYEWELFIADSREWGSYWPLIPEELSTILDHLYSMHPRLSDIFDIRQGIRIGRKSVFIIQNYHHMPQKERRILKPVVDDENLYDGGIHEDDRRLLYAYDRGKLLTASDMKSSFPKSLEYLTHFKTSLRRRARMGSKPIWALAEPRDYNLMFAPKIVSTHFGLTGSYAFDEKGEYAVTNGNLLIPKAVFSDRNAWFYYLAILNSNLFLRLVARKSMKLKGGQYDLDERFTKNTPIPSYDATPRSVRVNLVEMGRRTHREGLVSLDDVAYQEAVLAAYRLEKAEASII